MDDFDLYRLFKLLHVLAAIALVSGGIMEAIIGPIAARATSMQEVRAYARLVYISENYLSLPAAVAIAVFGYLTADRIGYDFFNTTWLLLGQIVFYTIAAIGLGVLRPAANRLYRLAREAPDGPVTPEVAAELAKPLPAIGGAATGLLFVAIIYLMVAKPAW